MAKLYGYEDNELKRIEVYGSDRGAKGVHLYITGVPGGPISRLVPEPERVKLARAIAGDRWGEDPRVEKLEKLVDLIYEGDTILTVAGANGLAKHLLDNGVEVPA